MKTRQVFGKLTLEVITPEEFNDLKDGTRLVCIDGSIVIKGVDKIDMDTRFGAIAYGFLRND